jgi:hypothetical protein
MPSLIPLSCCTTPQPLSSRHKRALMLYLLMIQNQHKHTPWKDRPLVVYKTKLDFDRLPDTANSLFRFEVDELKELSVSLLLPVVIITEYGYTSYALEALAAFCYRMAWPNRGRDLMKMFGHGDSWFSAITLEVAHTIFQRFGTLAKDFDPTRLGGVEELESLAAINVAKGCPLQRYV